MSVGLRWFLLFLAALAGALVVAAFLLGPNVLAFVFHEQRRTAPFVMVNLIEFHDAAAAARYQRDVSAEVLGLLEGSGARRVWSAQVDGTITGAARDRWQAFALVQYPSRASYVEMVTSSEYRAATQIRDTTVSRSALLVATPATPVVVPTNPYFVLRLMQFTTPDAADTYDSEWLPKETALVGRHDANVVWDARLDPLVGDPEDEFDRMILAGFASDSSRNAWMSDPERVTLTSLERRLLRRDVLLLLTPDR